MINFPKTLQLLSFDYQSQSLQKDIAYMLEIRLRFKKDVPHREVYAVVSRVVELQLMGTYTDICRRLTVYNGKYVHIAKVSSV